MNTRQLSLIIVFLAFAIAAQLNAQVVPLTLFKDSLVPKNGRGDLYDLSQSPYAFKVESVRDTLKVSFYSRNVDTTQCELNIPQGKLVGRDFAASGGSLVFASKKTGRADTIFDRYVQHIFTAHRYVYFTSSIWDPAKRYGQLYLLDTTTSKFQAKLVASFEYPIRRVCVVHDSIHLVSGGKLYRMQYGKPVYITDVPFTCNSMTVIGRYMYFGMNGAYARLDLLTKQYRYFVYKGQ